jgi:hypothetical protein
MHSPILFIAIPVIFVLILSRLHQESGWAEAAKIYRAELPLDKALFHGLQSGRMGRDGFKKSVHFRNSLMLAATLEGIFLSPCFIFRIGAPPLFIPWQEVSAQQMTGGYARFVEIRFQKVPSVALYLHSDLWGGLNWVNPSASLLPP